MIGRRAETRTELSAALGLHRPMEMAFRLPIIPSLWDPMSSFVPSVHGRGGSRSTWTDRLCREVYRSVPCIHSTLLYRSAGPFPYGFGPITKPDSIQEVRDTLWWFSYIEESTMAKPRRGCDERREPVCMGR
jgi:hypothetical protein